MWVLKINLILSTDVDALADEISKKEPLINANRVDQVKQLIHSKAIFINLKVKS